MTARFDSARVARDLRSPHAAPVIAISMQRSLEHKRTAQAEVSWAALRAHAHALKKDAIEHLDSILAEFERNFIARGGTVVWARTADEAAERFIQICRDVGTDSVVKGKSMLSEELELNERLRMAGIAAVETDLGEYIVQLAGQKPTHVIAPAAHLSRQDVGRIFERELKIPYSEDPRTLSLVARERLRSRYLKAGVGMTGVNFAIAETGTLIVVENEGNGGLSASVPPVHIAIMGIEKVIRRVADLDVFLPLLARAGTGQKITTYTHHFLGPEPGKRQYCIIVDAGRTNLLADPILREALYCIRCGACMNVCPVYRRVGGGAYGWVYPGPIGAVVTGPMLGTNEASDLPYASTLCGACKEECPVAIDLPRQLLHLRASAVENGAHGGGLERPAIRAFTSAMSDTKAYARGTTMLRAALALAAALPIRIGALGRWMRSRALPKPARKLFREWWARRS